MFHSSKIFFLCAVSLMLSCGTALANKPIPPQNSNHKEGLDMNDFQGRAEMLSQLFEQLDPQKMGESYRKALAAKDTDAMVNAAAEHFRNRAAIPTRKTLLEATGSVRTADRAVNADVTVVDIPWKFSDGNIDWRFNPTAQRLPVNHEWLWQLNRMYFWNDMCSAYLKTGNEKYAQAFNRQLRSWISIAGYPPAENWNAPGSIWRTIETGLRLMTSWSNAFETFRKSPSLSDENLCLMLSAMHRHAVHLQLHHKEKRNWLLMEMSGLYNFAVRFPEFKEHKTMREYAVKKFSCAIMEQILPDGFHSELSPDYHGVMTSCALTFIHIAKTQGIAAELPEEFMAVLEKSFNTVLDTAPPGLTSPRTNDCGTIKIARKMADAAELFPHRKDFLWAATGRKEGIEPASTPTASRFLPFSGFAVMRSNWKRDALFCIFDAGPLGEGHMHQDKLNINIYKGDEELICDDGGGHYENSVFRQYGVSAASHNTILIDGLVQSRKEPLKVDRAIDANWITNDKFDYAKSSYDGEFGALKLSRKTSGSSLSKPAVHTREVRFYKPDFFCVQDTLQSSDGKEHSYEMRLQLDTPAMKKVSGISGAWISDFKRKYDILIIPLFPDEVTISHLSGAKKPVMAGWFVGRDGVRKSSTLAITASEKKDFRFATLLIPIKKGEKLPEIIKSVKNSFTLKWKKRTHTIDLDQLAK